MSVTFTRNDDKLKTELGGETNAGFLPAAPHHIIPVSAFGDQYENSVPSFDHDAVNGSLTNLPKGKDGARVAIQQAYEEIRRKSFNVNDEKNGIWLPGDELDSIKFDLAVHSAGSDRPLNLEGGLHNRSNSYTKHVTKHLHAITTAYNKTLTLTLQRIEKAYDGKPGEKKQKDTIELSNARSSLCERNFSQGAMYLSMSPMGGLCDHLFQALTKTKGWRKSSRRNLQTCRVEG